MSWGFVGCVCCFVLYLALFRLEVFLYILAFFMRCFCLPLKYCLWVCSAFFVFSVASL